MQHPTIDELTRWRRGEIEGEQVLTIGAHLAACPECVERATQRLGLAKAAHALFDDVASAPQRGTRWWPMAVAASIAIAVVSVLLLRPRENAPQPVFENTVKIQPTPTAPARVEERRDLSDTQITMPDVLRELRAQRDVLRGDGDSNMELTPSGVIVRSARPKFSWPASKDAQYVVQVFRDEQEVARSGTLTTPSWQPERKLMRNGTYTWQVRVTRNGDDTILPASPAPVARFHVLNTKTLAELEGTELTHPDDHLLLGILCARVGLVSEARAHLERVTDARDVETAKRIQQQLDAWRITE